MTLEQPCDIYLKYKYSKPQANDLTASHHNEQVCSLNKLMAFLGPKICIAVKAGDGKSRLLISPRCERLIEAMQCYHYPDSDGPGAELPQKDGVYDHPIDALRYFFINYTRNKKAATRRY